MNPPDEIVDIGTTQPPLGLAIANAPYPPETPFLTLTDSANQERQFIVRADGRVEERGLSYQEAAKDFIDSFHFHKNPGTDEKRLVESRGSPYNTITLKCPPWSVEIHENGEMQGHFPCEDKAAMRFWAEVAVEFKNKMQGIYEEITQSQKIDPAV